MPEYLNFVKGLVDSRDLPLNVSREMLQQNDAMIVMKNYIVKKILEELVECSESTDPKEIEKYTTFYQNFNKNIKLGVYQDEKNRDKLMHILRYFSSNSKNQEISLKEYVTNMKEDQKGIYYISGESVRSVEDSPFLKYSTKKNYDVLFLTEAIDEYMMQTITEFDGKKFINVCKENSENDVGKNRKDRII